MPITPELYKRLKQNLRDNLKTLANLQSTVFKLKFDENTGRFEYELDSRERTARNMSSASPDTPTNQDKFANPILVTMYEAMQFGIADAKNALNGLKWLQKTYSGAKGKAIEEVIKQSEQLLSASDQPTRVRLINEWVKFEMPIGNPGIVSDGVWKIVCSACSDLMMKNLITQGVSSINQANMSMTTLINQVAGYIYSSYYKTGGDDIGSTPKNFKTKEYLKDLASLAAKYGASADPQGLGITLTKAMQRFKQGNLMRKNAQGKIVPVTSLGQISFIHFHSNSWGRKCSARVYIHLKYDHEGRAARKAVEIIFQQLGRCLSPTNLRGKFDHFKIGNLPMLYKYQDSIVMYTADYETAHELAKWLKFPLKDCTAAGLPIGPKEVSPGIGISTEPEVTFDPVYQSLQNAQEKYSFGNHRSEIIARGLIVAAFSTKPFNALPDPDTCATFVAKQFTALGIDPCNPHMKGNLQLEPIVQRRMSAPTRRRPGPSGPQIPQRRLSF
jgi:hypothetical protein